MFKKLTDFILLFILLGFVSLANAKVLFLDDKVKATSEVKAWAKNIVTKGRTALINLQADKDGYTECRETVELPSVVLCGTHLQRNMNDLLARVSFYSEGGLNYPKGTLVTTNDKYVHAMRDLIGGHDISSKEMLAFYDKISQKCANGKSAYCLTQKEQLFYDNVVLPLRKRGTDFIIITFTTQSTGSATSIVSHEFLHARYFLEPTYHDRIHLFWTTQMTQTDRDEIKATLKQIGYDNTNEGVMENEFQAYILMEGAEDSQLHDFVTKYRTALQNFVGITEKQ